MRLWYSTDRVGLKSGSTEKVQPNGSPAGGLSDSKHQTIPYCCGNHCGKTV